MLDPQHPIAKLARKDGRYAVEAYAFVFDALNYAHTVLGLGQDQPSEPEEDEPEHEGAERHLTGQELCEAMREYALDQYGYMAQCVLNSWGVERTGDIGEIVFNMIRVGHMKKTPQDRREDFNDVFDFDEAFVEGFKIQIPE